MGKPTLSKAATLRAQLEAALANYRGPVKRCPAAPPLVCYCNAGLCSCVGLGRQAQSMND
jgi:hypothetical protein